MLGCKAGLMFGHFENDTFLLLLLFAVLRKIVSRVMTGFFVGKISLTVDLQTYKFQSPIIAH